MCVFLSFSLSSQTPSIIINHQDISILLSPFPPRHPEEKEKRDTHTESMEEEDILLSTEKDPNPSQTCFVFKSWIKASPLAVCEKDTLWIQESEVCENHTDTHIFTSMIHSNGAKWTPCISPLFESHMMYFHFQEEEDTKCCFDVGYFHIRQHMHPPLYERGYWVRKLLRILRMPPRHIASDETRVVNERHRVPNKHPTISGLHLIAMHDIYSQFLSRCRRAWYSEVPRYFLVWVTPSD